jgi:plastocyanin
VAKSRIGSAMVATLALAVLALTLIGCTSKPTGAPLTSTPSKPATSTATTGTAPASAHAQVKITAKGFSPATVTVTTGGRVVWSNEDKAPHGIQILGGPSSGTLKSGGVASHVFEKPGTFDIADPLHPELQAVVIVR